MEEMLALSRKGLWSQAAEVVASRTQHFKSEPARLQAEPNDFDGIMAVLLETSIAMTTASLDPTPDTHLAKCITEIFRCLRNACAGCASNQTTVGKSSALASTRSILDIVVTQDTTDVTVTLQRCALQFLGNCCVGHEENQETVSKMFLPVFRCTLSDDDDGVVNYTCMVLHNCLLSGTQAGMGGAGLPRYLSFKDEVFSDVLLSVLQITACRDLEWGVYVLEDLIQISDFFNVFYCRLSQTERMFLMEVLITSLTKCEEDSEKTLCVAVDNLTFLAREIGSQVLPILQSGTADTDQDQSPLVLVKVIEALGMASSLHSLYGDLQDDPDLLECCINLLRSIHDIGRHSDNHFTSVEKIHDTGLVDTHHPAFGLKRDLIRLLANLVFRHTKNQDKVRELGGIPLILDQSNIDKKNPFITQWVVLAIRNLCEDNAGNRKFLSNTKLEGLANSVELLREFGVKAELQGDKIVVRPPDEVS